MMRVYYQHIDAEDLTVIDGIRVTNPARTLLDLAMVSDERELEEALTAALASGITSPSEILTVIARYPHHRGGRRLKGLLEAWFRNRPS